MTSLAVGTAAFNIFITILMVATGSINTLAGKFTDSTVVNGKHFDHPFFQKRQKRLQISNQEPEIFEGPRKSTQKINNWIFLPLAVLDATSSSINYVALILTNASSYQMLRGSVIIFTGLMSTGFLGMRLKGFQWVGMILVTLGLLVIGLTDYIYGDAVKDDINGIITGDLLIIISQIIVAIHVCAEQKFLTQYDLDPLKVVGMEGLFGLIVVSIAMIPMYFIYVSPTFSNNPHGRLEDVICAIKEIAVSPRLQITITITILSMAFFNFSNLVITKRLSATTVTVLDSIRILVIWMFSIPLFGQQFIGWQIIGFILLILGLFTYNDVYFGPKFRDGILPKMRDGRVKEFLEKFLCGLDEDVEEDREILLEN